MNRPLRLKTRQGLKYSSHFTKVTLMTLEMTPAMHLSRRLIATWQQLRTAAAQTPKMMIQYDRYQLPPLLTQISPVPAPFHCVDADVGEGVDPEEEAV